MSWLLRVRSEGEGAFNELYEEVAPALFAWARVRIRAGRGVHLDPADLVQEVWCRAWRGLDDLDESIPLRPWLFRIAKNVLLESLRAHQRDDRGGGMGPSTRHMVLQNAPDFATTVSRRMMRNENLAAFDEALRGMPNEERDLIVLCGLEGLPLRDVAARLGLGLEAVTKRWQRLRERLATGPGPADLLQ
jgi:RNA polymerase sigma-70 factor (ECF subfamily)